MKGIVFTEFLEMVEQKFGLETVDEIITRSELPSGGAYTSVGIYDFFEMQRLILNLNEITGITVDDLIYTYGCYFFQILVKHHSDILNMYSSPILLLASIEDHIHVQVRKIYPGAELPTFKIITQSNNYLEMMYLSERSMYMFAKALMDKTFQHYHENSKIELEKLKADGSEVLFKIYKQPHAITQKT
ncbi:MAG: heme NO-binding domain-containing protein [Leeuwenhoekiella sp.]